MKLRELLETIVTESTLSVDVPTEEWLQDKIDYAKKKGRNEYGVPYMGSTTASVRGTPPKVRVVRLHSLRGMRREQTNVRYNDLKWLMDYMDKNKKLPPMGSSPDSEYLPYIMVAYNGEAWVNEGNHRIMAAYRLGWDTMPIEIRYFDGGERVEDGPMYPGKIGLGNTPKVKEQGVAEGSEQINEYRDRLLQYVKSLLPTWPDYVLKDWLVPNKGDFSNLPTDALKNGVMEKVQGAGLTPNSKWQLVPDMKFTMDMFDPMTKQRLIGRAGGSSDLGMGIPKDKERHATQAALAQQQGGVRKEPVLLIKTAKGYELLEGWHRTIQHFVKYPEGYTGPAYVAVAQGQQGVAEGSGEKMSVQDTLAYLQKVMGTASHEDWRNHIVNTNKYFVLKEVPVSSLKSDLSGLNKDNVEKYKQMDFSKAPPIVIGSDGNILDGYHRVNVAKALRVPTLKAWVGVKKQGVAEGSLEELANTSLKVKEPKDFVNTNDRKQVTYKVMKFKSGKDTYLINFTVKGAPAFGKKQNWNAVNVAFGVREEQDDYSFGDEINTDLTAKNKNQFIIYSTVINAVRKFITEYNTEIDEIIMQGAGERQVMMYQRFFRVASKYFPGWHYDGEHSLVRDVPRQKTKKIKEEGVAEGSDSNLSYQGNCTEDDVIEHIFGDVNNFANMVEKHGDEFTVGDLVVKYDPETDVHSFYYKKQGVAEARSNPEQNVKLASGMKELIAIYKDISDIENWAISMTGEAKLGINPGVGISEDTPKGIYFYPLDYAVGMIQRRQPLPWGDNMPYIQLFQYDRSKEMTKETQVDPARLKQALLQYCPAELIQHAIDDPEYDDTPYWIIYDCLSRLGKSDETNIVRWNKVLRDLGFTSVVDDGAGWIAPGEPTQGVVLDPRIIKQHKTIKNRREAIVVTPAKIEQAIFGTMDMELAANRVWQKYDPDGSKLRVAAKEYAKKPDFKPWFGKPGTEEMYDKASSWGRYGARQLSQESWAWYKEQQAQQPVKQESLEEAPLADYEPLGDFTKPGPFTGADKKLIPHPANQLKAEQFFSKTPYDIRLFFSNLTGTGKYSEYGVMAPDVLKIIFGDDADKIINGHDDAITVVYVGNKGDSKKMLTPWVMAHRLGHAIQAGVRSKGLGRKDPDHPWARGEDHFFKAVNSMLEEHYGKRGTAGGDLKYELTPEYNALFNAMGTQRSSRSNEIRRPYEFLYEIFAQYLGTGKVTFNPLPANLAYGRKAWGNPTKYMNIKPEYKEETDRHQIADQLAYDMELMFNDVMSQMVGKILVM